MIDSLQTHRQIKCARSPNGHVFTNDDHGVCIKCGLSIEAPYLARDENKALYGSNPLLKGSHMVDTDRVLNALPLAKKRRFTKKRIFGTLALVGLTSAVSAKIARSDAFATPEPETAPEHPWTGSTS